MLLQLDARDDCQSLSLSSLSLSLYLSKEPLGLINVFPAAAADDNFFEELHFRDRSGSFELLWVFSNLGSEAQMIGIWNSKT